MAVEYTGFIYVLSYGADTFEYHQMNIYTSRPGGYSPIGSTPTVMNAARLTVDFWRSVYSLYYEVIPRLNPNNATPPPVTALGQPVDTVQRGADVQLAAAPPSA